jgi:hypothetical protein
MNVEIGTETPIFLFWEYLFLFEVCSVQAEDYSELNMFISIFTGEHFFYLFHPGTQKRCYYITVDPGMHACTIKRCITLLCILKQIT